MKIQSHLNATNTHPAVSPTWFDDFQKTIERADIGFFDLPKRMLHSPELNKLKEVHRQFSSMKHFIHIGIGGSALGPQMLIDALGTTAMDFHFWDNSDSDIIAPTLNKCRAQDTLIYVVSKSGGTAETMSELIIAMNWLKSEGISKENFKKHIVVCSDPEKGDLKSLATDLDLISFEVPQDIGGRFSVLTAVGLFPALFAGINIDELLKGASSMAESIMGQKQDHALFHLTRDICFLKDSQNINQTILMPYSSRLKSLSSWFVQLWAESLGKINTNGIATGLTPIVAYGATDQHAQVQLFMEGVNDKFFLILSLDEKEQDFQLDAFEDFGLASFDKLKGKTLNKLIAAQAKGTTEALKQQQRNLATLNWTKLDAHHLGETILFLESLTATTAIQLEVDAFNQPGVELGKKLAFQYLQES